MDPVILDEAQVRVRSETRVEESEGVARVVLWQQQSSTAGLLWIDPDGRMDEHVHPDHVHHVWLIDGSVTVLGRDLAAGSYVFVPVGEPHALAAGPEGCRLFYLYLEA